MRVATIVVAALAAAAEARQTAVMKINAAAMDYHWQVTNWEAGHTRQGAYYSTAPPLTAPDRPS